VSVLVLLIFASLAIATAFLAGFIWAVRSGQYEDTCTPSMRVLVEDAARAGKTPAAAAPPNSLSKLKPVQANSRVAAQPPASLDSCA